MNDPERTCNDLREISIRNGATVFGVGGVGEHLSSFPLLSETLRSGMTHAISLGIELSGKILDEIEDGPTQLYYFHYRRINQSLDHIGIVLTAHIQQKGFNAIPFPASQTIDWDDQRGHLSHKAIGRLAGHGWIGRNNLLVHPRYGSAVRYTTVLTDMPLPTDPPAPGNCGKCRKCIRACPASAISEAPESFDREACLEMLKVFSKRYQIRHYICGICVKVCRLRTPAPQSDIGS